MRPRLDNTVRKGRTMHNRRGMLARSASLAAALAGLGLLPRAAQAAWSQAAFEAMVRSGALFAEGLEGIGQAWMGVAQAAMHDGAATAQAIIAAKSPRQVLELQANFARATFDRMVTESGRLPALSVGVANRKQSRSRYGAKKS